MNILMQNEMYIQITEIAESFLTHFASKILTLFNLTDEAAFFPILTEWAPGQMRIAPNLYVSATLQLCCG